MYFIVITALISLTNALTPPPITGTTPPPIDCPNSYCDGRYDGNYEIPSEPNYFVQCVSGLAYCQPCWPLHLVFVGRCNQCLYNRNDDCATTEPWAPATTYYCPDECPNRGPHFSGNINDPSNAYQYVACWNGATVGCIACPNDLKFNEEWNACLYEGKYKTARSIDTHSGEDSSSSGGHRSRENGGYDRNSGNRNGGYSGNGDSNRNNGYGGNGGSNRNSGYGGNGGSNRNSGYGRNGGQSGNGGRGRNGYGNSQSSNRYTH